MANAMHLQGNEQVLVINAMRGSIVCGIAERVPNGKVICRDPWGTEEVKMPPAWAIENASRLGLSERVDIGQGDPRQLDFKDGELDVVVAVIVPRIYKPRVSKQCIVTFIDISIIAIC
jgi:hypothetical protein